MAYTRPQVIANSETQCRGSYGKFRFQNLYSKGATLVNPANIMSVSAPIAYKGLHKHQSQLAHGEDIGQYIYTFIGRGGSYSANTIQYSCIG